MMPSDARPNFKTGCVWDKAPQERHPHSRLVPQMFCFINQKPKSSTNHEGRTHERIYQTFVFIAAVGVYSLQLLCMKLKGTLHNFSFSHVWTSLCSQQGQIYFGPLNGNNVECFTVMLPSVKTLNFPPPSWILPVENRASTSKLCTLKEHVHANQTRREKTCLIL